MCSYIKVLYNFGLLHRDRGICACLIIVSVANEPQAAITNRVCVCVCARCVLYIICMRTNEERMYLYTNKYTLKSVMCVIWIHHDAYFVKVSCFSRY